MRGKIIYAVLVFLLVFSWISAAAAGSFDVETSVYDNNYVRTATDVARYKIIVTNNYDAIDHFRISFPDESSWTILTEPEIYYKTTGFDLEPGESLEFYFSVRPKLSAVESGYLGINQRYQIIYQVKSETADEIQSDFVILYYGPKFEKPRYPAVVLADIELPEKVDPRQELEVRVILENKNPLNITALDIYLTSELVNQHVVVDLSPLEKKTVVVKQPLDPLETPKTDELSVKLMFEGQVVELKKDTYEIIAYSQFEEKQNKVRDTFYKTTTYLEYRNNGNIEKTETVKHQTSGIETLFLTTEPKATLLKEDGKRYLSWQLELAPNETKTVKLINNYLPIYILLALLLLALIAARLMKGAVTVQKHALLLAKKEGGIAGVKVILKIKNISSRPIHEVEIVDSVPNIVEIDKNVEMGHIAPLNVVDRGRLGILIKWKLGSIEPGEERVVSYKAHARLTILGSFTLPAAVLRGIQSYKEKVVYSNRLRIKL